MHVTLRTSRGRGAARAVALLSLVVSTSILLVAGPGRATVADDESAVGAGGRGMIATFAWRPGAHISDALDLVVMNADGSSAQVLVPGAAQRSLCGFDLDWSPDGNRIAWASGGQVWTIRADGTGRVKVADGCVGHVEWAPDGNTLAVEIDSRTGLLNLGNGAFRWVRSCALGETDVTFSPDGTLLAGGGTADCDLSPSGWGIYGFDVATGAVPARYVHTEPRAQDGLAYVPDGLEWHPTQARIATSFHDTRQGGTCHGLGATGYWSNSDIYLLTPVADSPLLRVGSTTGEYDWSEFDASWSPDGTRLLYSATRNVSCQDSSYVMSTEELFTSNPDGTGMQRIWTPWNQSLGFVGSSWQPCTATTTVCTPVPQDGDGDGVLDAADACPLEPGPASNAGCPVDPTDPPPPGPTPPAPTPDSPDPDFPDPTPPTVPAPTPSQPPSTADEGTGGAMASTCGRASQKWLDVTGHAMSVKKSEGVCVFVVSNEGARLLLRTAVKTGEGLGPAFAGAALDDAVVAFTDDAYAKSVKALAKHTFFRSLRNALGTNVTRLNPIVAAGKLVAVAGLPIVAGKVVNQITSNDACLQFVVDRDKNRLSVDWSMVYAHTKDKTLNQANVYEKVDKKFALDDIKPVYLGMGCQSNGEVWVNNTPSRAMDPRVSTLFRVR